MTLLRPQTLIAGVSETPAPRSALSTVGVQLVSRGGVVWAKKAGWFRNPPYTVGPAAHLGQLEVRLAFADAARQAKGSRGLDPETGLPHAAAHVMRKLRGYRAADSMRPEEYPSRIRRTAYTAEELRTILEEKARRKAAAPARR